MICVPIFAERIDDFWAQPVEVRHALRLVHLWSDQFAFLCSQYPNWVQRIESLIAKSFADRISPPSLPVWTEREHWVDGMIGHSHKFLGVAASLYATLRNIV